MKLIWSDQHDLKILKMMEIFLIKNGFHDVQSGIIFLRELPSFRATLNLFCFSLLLRFIHCFFHSSLHFGINPIINSAKGIDILLKLEFTSFLRTKAVRVLTSFIGLQLNTIKDFDAGLLTKVVKLTYLKMLNKWSEFFIRVRLRNQ